MSSAVFNPKSSSRRPRPMSAPNLSTPDRETAAAVSQRIDEDLRKEAVLRREARRKELRILLLGQAESGKSTLQKQFQLLYASHSLDSERPSWRPVVYFNIIKAVRIILAELEYEFSNDADDSDSDLAQMSSEVLEEISKSRVALLPLVSIEDSLASELNGGVSIPGGRNGAYVRSEWQIFLSQKQGTSAEASPDLRLPETFGIAARVLAKSTNEIKALWANPTVKICLEQRRIRLEESAALLSEFNFLDHVERIAQPDYVPTTDDILRVRLRTLGVIEHNFPVDMGGSIYNWRLFDVGGARCQRPAWVPYFDDAISIIFLAPISAFDQYLEEEVKVNRIDDSLQLFSSICSNKIFKDVHLVLMLNKADLLKKKLTSGIKVRKYITSYGNRPNTYESVASYFRSHFAHVHKKHSERNRALYLHFTSMLDIKATQSIITDVGEAIVRKHIDAVGLI